MGRYLPHSILASLGILAVVSSHAWKAAEAEEDGAVYDPWATRENERSYRHRVVLRRTGEASRWDDDMAEEVAEIGHTVRAEWQGDDRIVVHMTHRYDPVRGRIIDPARTTIRDGSGVAVAAADIERVWFEAEDMLNPCRIRLRSETRGYLRERAYLSREGTIRASLYLRRVDARTFAMRGRDPEGADMLVEWFVGFRACAELQAAVLGSRWEIESVE